MSYINVWYLVTQIQNIWLRYIIFKFFFQLIDLAFNFREIILFKLAIYFVLLIFLKKKDEIKRIYLLIIINFWKFEIFSFLKKKGTSLIQPVLFIFTWFLQHAGVQWISQWILNSVCCMFIRPKFKLVFGNFFDLILIQVGR